MLYLADAHVGEHLFNEAICGVLRNQTRVLVTHQLQFLPQVDRIIVMDKGRVLHEGSYVQLMAAGVSFASLAAGDESPQPQSGPPDQASVHSSPRVTSSDPLSAMVPMALRRSSSTGSDASDDLTPLPAVSLLRSSSTDSTPGKSAGQQVAAMGQAVQLAVGKAVEEEERYVGTVQASVYKMYMKSLGGLKFAIPFAILSIALECVRTGTSLWLAAWADDPQADIHKQMAVYVSLGVLTSILSLIRNFGWFHATYLASRKLHARMLGSVIRAPMGWFNATPQVLSTPCRFSLLAFSPLYALRRDAFSIDSPKT